MNQIYVLKNKAFIKSLGKGNQVYIPFFFCLLIAKFISQHRVSL